jgi:outer membrane lipoprotein carrier protein
LFAIKNSGRKLFVCRRFLLFLTAVSTGVLFFFLPREAPALSIGEVIAKAQEQYEKTRDIKADFLQEASIKSMNKTDREEGVFYFKNPRRMVWDYLKPKPKKLIINPQTAWLYIPEDRIVYVQDAESIFKSEAGIRFLSGLGKLNKDFHITFSSPDAMDREGNFLVKLVPKERGFGIEEFFLTLDKEQFLVTRLSFTDGFGNTTRLLFRNIRINNNLAEKLFSFSPPAGVEVYKTR